jgi:hypothetical protein
MFSIPRWCMLAGYANGVFSTVFPPGVWPPIADQVLFILFFLFVKLGNLN